jgi:hypothetical protein
LKRAHIFRQVRVERFGVTCRIALDRRRNLLEPLFELAGDPRAVVKEIAGSSLVVNEAARVEIPINCLEDRDAAGCLLNR